MSEGRDSDKHGKTAKVEACATHTQDPPVGEESDSSGPVDDVAALQGHCEYLANEVKNLQDRYSALPPQAQQCVDGLTRKLQLILPGGSGESRKPPKKSSEVSRSSPKVVLPVLKCSETDTGDESEVSHVSSTKKKKKAVRKVKRETSVRMKRETSASSEESFKSSVSDATKTSSTERESRKASRRTHGSSRSDTPAALNVVQLAALLSRLDTRSVPKPENFDLESGQSFKDFLKTFEEYCSNTFRGSTALWVSELPRFLQGSIRDAYTALWVPNDTYKSMKAKLLKWCRDSSEVIELDIRKRFERIKLLPGESLRIYAARLERAFCMAFPNRHAEHSKTLQRKFLDTVPKSFKKQISTTRSISLTMNKRDLTWSTILSLASRQDAEQGTTSDSDGGNLDGPEVWASTLPASPSIPPNPFVEDQSRTSALSPHAREWHPTAQNSRLTVSGRSASLGRQASQSWDRNSDRGIENRRCHYCYKQGHIRADCRRLNGSCLVCGSSDHQIARCPRRRGIGPGRSRWNSGKNVRFVDESGRRVFADGQPLPSAAPSTSQYQAHGQASAVPPSEALNSTAPAGQGTTRWS